jgi:ferritin
MKQPLISNKFVFELEQRIQGELQAESMYRQLSASMQSLGFFGASKFFLKEADQEVIHYQKIIDFCNDLGVLPEISNTFTDLKVDSLQLALKTAYDAELNLLNEYKKLSSLSMEEPTLFYFSLEFVKEQVKSVGEFGDLLSRLELTKEPILLDQEL